MFLGIDLGTSSVKLVLTDGRGNPMGEAGASYGAYGIEEGYFEQEPAEWISCISNALLQLKSETPPAVWRGIKSIGLSAQMPTLVLLENGGAILHRAIVWCDSRAEGQGERLLNQWGAERHYERTGTILDGRYLVPMYQWVAENKPQILDFSCCILSAKDYLFYWLTGLTATDPSTASGFGVYNLSTNDWDWELCAEAGISRQLLPRILESHCSYGMKSELAGQFGLDPSVQVCIGAADSVAGVLGTGAVDEGTVCQICGSSTAILLVCNDANPDQKYRFMITPLAKKGTLGLEADILSTGKTSQWLAELLNVQPSELSALACQAPAGSEGLIFTPYLSGGEQSVLWDPDLSGFIMGLSYVHKAAHLTRAHYEGICFEAKRCIDAFAGSGHQVKRVLVTGPVSSDGFFMQLMADVLGICCFSSEIENASAYGAAILAGICTGDLDWGTAAEMKSADGKEFEPDLELHKRYLTYYEKYIEAASGSKMP